MLPTYIPKYKIIFVLNMIFLKQEMVYRHWKIIRAEKTLDSITEMAVKVTKSKAAKIWGFGI